MRFKDFLSRDEVREGLPLDEGFIHRGKFAAIMKSNGFTVDADQDVIRVNDGPSTIHADFKEGFADFYRNSADEDDGKTTDGVEFDYVDGPDPAARAVELAKWCADKFNVSQSFKV